MRGFLWCWSCSAAHYCCWFHIYPSWINFLWYTIIICPLYCSYLYFNKNSYSCFYSPHTPKFSNFWACEIKLTNKIMSYNSQLNIYTPVNTHCYYCIIQLSIFSFSYSLSRATKAFGKLDVLQFYKLAKAWTI